MATRLVDIGVWAHRHLPGHNVYVRGRFPYRIWRCARHDCDWTHEEAP